MMTSSNGNILHVTGLLCGEFTSLGEFPTQRPVTRGFGVFFDLRLNKQLSKQSWGWWFETPTRSLWRHRNDFVHIYNTSQWLCTRFMFCWALVLVDFKIYPSGLLHCHRSPHMIVSLMKNILSNFCKGFSIFRVNFKNNNIRAGGCFHLLRSSLLLCGSDLSHFR